LSGFFKRQGKPCVSQHAWRRPTIWTVQPVSHDAIEKIEDLLIALQAQAQRKTLKHFTR
jgi:hypothetical protein